MKHSSFSVSDLLGLATERLRFRLPDDPVPTAWRGIVDRNVPLARRLDGATRERLLHIAQQLLTEIPFEGCGALQITEEVRVTIAATASLLLVGMRYPRFTKVVRILVYPEAFVPVREPSPRGSQVEREPRPAVGEAWRDGMIVLSWEDVMNDASRPEAGHSVVLHEFAHMLDVEDGRMNGIPLLDNPEQQGEWVRVIEETFATARDEAFALDAYAAENEAELFAVATETFFSLPAYMQPRLPAFYVQLCAYYGRDPSK